MKDRTLFDYTDYKAYLRDLIAENKGFRGYQSRLSDAAGCQRSFLSQVLNGPMELSREHAAELCRYWHFDAVQSEYFLSLVDLARAGSRALKELVRERLEKLRIESQDIKNRLKSEEIHGPEAQAVYYSAWYWAAVHLLVALPDCHTPQAIAGRLGMPLELVKATLLKLEALGLIDRTANGWTVGKRDIHLPDGSPLAPVNHGNWRERATHNARLRDKEALHYTSVFTMGRADAEKVRERVRATILEARDAIAPSPNEELYCFTVDFFTV